MSEIYNAEYYKEYDVGCGKVDYSDSEYTKGFLTQIAQKIADDLHPRTVLDAGCAMGHLVAALRDLGVEAYGVDISKYAISKVREDIRPFCKVGSLTEPLPAGLPDRYDLVVTVEVLEHLYEDEGRQAIRNICKLTDEVLFTSTPDDFTEPTHVNVQQREYWCRVFFENGFVDDLNYRPRYLTSHALLFRRSANMGRQIEDYERNIRISECVHQQETAHWSKAVEDKERHIQNITAQHAAENAAWAGRQNEWAEKENEWRQEKQRLEASAASEMERLQQALRSKETECETQAKEADGLRTELTCCKEQYRAAAHQCETLETELAQYKDQYHTSADRCGTLEAELAHYKEHYHAAIGQREALKIQLAGVQNAYSAISNAFFWKITKPFRVCLDALKRILGKVAFFRLIGKGIRCLHENGWSYTWHKVKNKLKHRQEYTALTNTPLFTEEELEAQRAEVFPRSIKFSIVVPLYNTPEKFLHEMIRSVIDQTYADWELCMADGSDEAHGNVERICRQYMRKDLRIKYQRLEENLGISGNTNACLEMATGDYIGLFDHDDLLHPAALHEVMRAICEQDADFIYTDELTFSNKVENVITAHFKPNFAPDNLRANNYICHFTVFSVDILKKIGGFRGEYDGSQDHDFILRATEQARKIVHIPQLLYFWRSHPASVAADINSKTYAIDAGKRAVHDHIRRMGMEATVESSKAFPTIYRIKYELKETPKVSIIIPNKNHCEDLKRCIKSIQDLTTYPDYEIIIVDNQSTEKKLVEYYNQLKCDDRISIAFFNKEFNYSEANNFGVKYATGEYYILLNNDIEVISPTWIEEMLMYAQRDDVGAVGVKLYFPDHTIQHAGVILGLGPHGTAGHAFSRVDGENLGYMGRLYYAQNMSAVTAACVMIPRRVWEEVDGLDTSFAMAFNDIDLCMRIRKAGYLIVWTPYAELYHYESKSRGSENTPEKKERFEREVRCFRERWKKELEAGDPYYNPNLTLERADFSIKQKNER